MRSGHYTSAIQNLYSENNYQDITGRHLKTFGLGFAEGYEKGYLIGLEQGIQLSRGTHKSYPNSSFHKNLPLNMLSGTLNHQRAQQFLQQTQAILTNLTPDGLIAQTPVTVSNINLIELGILKGAHASLQPKLLPNPIVCPPPSAAQSIMAKTQKPLQVLSKTHESVQSTTVKAVNFPQNINVTQNTASTTVKVVSPPQVTSAKTIESASINIIKPTQVLNKTQQVVQSTTIKTLSPPQVVQPNTVKMVCPPQVSNKTSTLGSNANGNSFVNSSSNLIQVGGKGGSGPNDIMIQTPINIRNVTADGLIIQTPGTLTNYVKNKSCNAAHMVAPAKPGFQNGGVNYNYNCNYPQGMRQR